MNIIAILRIVEYVHENEASLFRYESMLFLLIILISDENETDTDILMHSVNVLYVIFSENEVLYARFENKIYESCVNE